MPQRHSLLDENEDRSRRTDVVLAVAMRLEGGGHTRADACFGYTSPLADKVVRWREEDAGTVANARALAHVLEFHS